MRYLAAMRNLTNWTILIFIFSSIVESCQFATSQQLSTQASSDQMFQVLRNATTGAILCSLEEPAASAVVRSALECGSRCAQLSSGCTNFNIRTSANGVITCETFFALPFRYGSVSNCTLYEVIYRY